MLARLANVPGLKQAFKEIEGSEMLRLYGRNVNT